jgi:outer membrane protein TolC
MLKNLILIITFSQIIYSITLQELIEIGLENSATLEKSRIQIELIEAKQKENRAKKLGEFDLVGSYNHYNLPRTLAPIVPSALSPNSSVETTKDLFSTGVSYSVPLFTGGAIQEQIEIDNISKIAQIKRKNLSKQEYIYNIRSLYLSGLSIQELILSQSNYIEAIEQLKSIISTSVEVGKKAKIDYIKIDTMLKSEEGKLKSLNSSLKMVKSNLKAITHIDDIDILEPISVKIEQSIESIDENLDSLDRFQLQDLEIQKGQRVQSKVEASLKPQVSLNGYLGYNYDIDNSIEKKQLWQVGLNLKWNIFDFNRDKARVQQAKIARLKSIIEKKVVGENFKKLIAKAINNIEEAIIEYNTNLAQINLLEETQNIEKARYDAGVATLNDLIVAKAKTQLAKAKLIELQYKYQNGLYYLDYLLERGDKQ